MHHSALTANQLILEQNCSADEVEIYKVQVNARNLIYNKGTTTNQLERMMAMQDKQGLVTNNIKWIAKIMSNK